MELPFKLPMSFPHAVNENDSFHSTYQRELHLSTLVTDMSNRESPLNIIYTALY